MKMFVDLRTKPATRPAVSSKWWRHNVPPGLGSHITWDTRLDGRLAQAVVSIQAVKGAEIGRAAEGAASYGSQVQDTIQYNREQRQFTRGANRAGGLEGGMTNGQDVVVRGFLKPISTLRRPLESVDLETRERRSRLMSVATLCGARGGSDRRSHGRDRAGAGVPRKFGGDSLGETRRNFDSYKEQVRNF